MKTTKKTYTAPKLVKIGDIGQVTQGTWNGGNGGSWDGSSSVR